MELGANPGGLLLDLGSLGIAYAASAVYLICAHRLRGRQPALRLWRVGLYLCGVFVVLLSVDSPLGRWSDELLSVHMAQHLVLIMVAAPLIAAGQPAKVVLRALPPKASRWMVRTMRARLGVCGSPAVRVCVLSAVIAGTHFSPVYDLAVRNELAHALEHLLYIASAYWFWSILVGSGRRLSPVWTVSYLLFAMPAMAAVGAVYMASSRPLYGSYLAPAHRLGVSAMADQHLAGALMWIGGSAAVTIALVCLAWSRLRAEERLTRARDTYPRRTYREPPTPTPGTHT
jgi:cytochrome c oxidase assembly factor CtaG